MASTPTSSAPGPDYYLGIPWEPAGAPMPDPNTEMDLSAPTERNEDNTLLAPNRSKGLGFSRYV